MILPDKDKVLAALALAYKLELEEQTGREVTVTWITHAENASTSGTAWSGTGQGAESTRR